LSYQNATGWAQEALGIVNGKGKAPKKPKAPRRARAATIPKSLIYPKITAKNPISVSKEEKIGAGLAAYGSRGAARRAAAALAKGPYGKALGAATGLLKPGFVLSAAALAGLAAYFATSALINRNARTKEELRQNAFEASQAYRRLRLEAAAKQRRPLTPAQQRAAAAAYKRALLDLGLSSHDLKKLNVGFFDKPDPKISTLGG